MYIQKTQDIWQLLRYQELHILRSTHDFQKENRFIVYLKIRGFSFQIAPQFL